MDFWNTRNMLAPPTYTYEANADEIDINHFKTFLQDGMSFYNAQNLLDVESATLNKMDFWNTRNMLAPPTYTYEANADEIDINHFKTILQDGMSFYNAQNLLDVEVALLSRIVYRMKTKFRNSKDFQTLEKVKKDLHIFEEINISKKLEYLFSILPSFNYHEVVVSLPTKNMIDFILVQLQGMGKILCRAIETCKHTVIIYEHRLYLGHFWKLALIAIALVSRIHILCLNIIKFTCLLYVRLLPFSHKLKNVTTNWLPKEYVFPKDLKNWLNVEWCKLEEVIEIPEEFNLSLINLVDDSDDEVEFIENDEIEMIEDFRKIRKTQIENLNFDSVRAFTSKRAIDLGEEIVINEDEIQIEESDENSVEEINVMPSSEKNEEIAIVEEVNIGEEISASENNACEVPVTHTEQKMQQVDIGEVILSEDEVTENQLIISSDDEDKNASVQFVAGPLKPRKPCVTSDFIPLEESTPSLRFGAGKFQNPKFSNRGKKKKKNKNTSVVIIPDTPTPSVKQSAFHKALKRKLSDGNGSSNKKLPNKKKKKNK